MNSYVEGKLYLDANKAQQVLCLKSSRFESEFYDIDKKEKYIIEFYSNNHIFEVPDFSVENLNVKDKSFCISSEITFKLKFYRMLIEEFGGICKPYTTKDTDYYVCTSVPRKNGIKAKLNKNGILRISEIDFFKIIYME